MNHTNESFNGNIEMEELFHSSINQENNLAEPEENPLKVSQLLPDITDSHFFLQCRTSLLC
jgi:hypothetical protein